MIKSTPEQQKTLTSEPPLVLQTEEEYQVAFRRATELFDLGDNGLSEAQGQELVRLATALEAFDDLHHPFPKTLAQLIKSRAARLELADADLARQLAISELRLQEIFAGAALTDIEISAVEQVLGIPANYGKDEPYPEG